MKRRGAGLIHVKREYGKRNPSFFLPRIGLFQRLAGESRLRAALHSNSARGGQRWRAWTSKDAPSQCLARRIEPRLLRMGCPTIHARLAFRPPLAAFWGTKSNDSADLEKRKRKSHRGNAPVGDNVRIIKTNILLCARARPCRIGIFDRRATRVSPLRVRTRYGKPFAIDLSD